MCLFSLFLAAQPNDLLKNKTRHGFDSYTTLRAETFAGINFRVIFRVFWSFLRKFLPLEIINHQNANVFSRIITWLIEI